MIKNKFFNYILIILSITFIYTKDQSIIFQVYNFDKPDSKIKSINYELQDSDGNLIKKGKIKKGFLKRKFKIKYNFNSNKDPESSITRGRYKLIVKYTIDDTEYQNALEIRKAWYADPDYIEYRSISGEYEQAQLTSNKNRGITLTKVTYPYEYKLPLKLKTSIIEGKVVDDSGNPIRDADVVLSSSLKPYIGNVSWLDVTGKNGEFKFEIDLSKDAPKNLEASIIITKKGYFPKQKPISYRTLKKRESINIRRVPIINKEKKSEIYCESPRVWNDICSECVCENSNEIWYYELGACDVRDCKDSNQQIKIGSNNKIICEDPPSNFDDNYFDDDIIDDRSECFVDLKLLKSNYNKCRKNKRALKQVKNILSNYNCSFDLSDYMNNIYLINALYSNVMSLSDDDFIDLYSNRNSEINQFEYLDIIFTHINFILGKDMDVSMKSIKINSNIQPYLADMYLKQAQFYYKYFELLYSLRSEYLDDSPRKPRQYIFDIDSEDIEDRLYYNTKTNTLTNVQQDIYEKLGESVAGYEEALENARNYGMDASSGIGEVKQNMEWIPFVLGW